MKFEDLTPFIAPLLLIAGVVLQYLVRSNSKENDAKYLGWATGACVLVYGLCVPHVGAWNAQIVNFLVWLLDVQNGAVWKVVAGSGTMSVLANIAVKLGANAQHPAVPVTNSKGEIS